MLMQRLILLLVIAYIALQALAGPPGNELPALQAAIPGKLINDPTRMDWEVYGTGGFCKAVHAADIAGGGALQFNVSKVGRTAYEFGASVPMLAAIAKGTMLDIAFYARTLSAATADGRARVGVRFQENAAPYAGFGDALVVVGPEWQLYEVSAVADRDIEKGRAVASLQLSAARQTIEIGQTLIVAGVSTIRREPLNPHDGQLPAALIGQGIVISEPSQEKWEFYGAGATHAPIVVKGMPNPQALQFKVEHSSANAYESGINIPINADIQSGEVVTIAVLARTVHASTADGLGKVGVRITQRSSPYPGFGDHMLAIGPTWKLYQIKTQATLELAKGQAAANLQLAAAEQTIEIDGVYVLAAPTP